MPWWRLQTANARASSDHWRVSVGMMCVCPWYVGSMRETAAACRCLFRVLETSIDWRGSHLRGPAYLCPYCGIDAFALALACPSFELMIDGMHLDCVLTLRAWTWSLPGGYPHRTVSPRYARLSVGLGYTFPVGGRRACGSCALRWRLQTFLGGTRRVLLAWDLAIGSIGIAWLSRGFLDPAHRSFRCLDDSLRLLPRTVRDLIVPRMRFAARESLENSAAADVMTVHGGIDAAPWSG